MNSIFGILSEAFSIITFGKIKEYSVADDFDALAKDFEAAGNDIRWSIRKID